MKKDYILIKINLRKDITGEYVYPFFIFKIFKSYTQFLSPIREQNETLYISFSTNEMKFFTSTLPNLRTFEKKETNSIIYQKETDSFPFIILPTYISYQVNNRIFSKNIYGQIFLGEKSFHNYLSYIFDTAIKRRFTYFDINDNYTFYIKSYSEFPEIYYAEEINDESLEEISNDKFERFKRLNSSNNIQSFNGPFALYLPPNKEIPYINFVLNKDDNFNIMKYDSNKYLIENKEYLLSAPSKLMVRIEESFDSNITIYNEGNIISTLNENNKYFL